MTTVNGIMSALNNIFLIICMAYFQGFEGLKQKYPVLQDKDKWILSTLVAFVVLMMILLILDNVQMGNSLIGKYLVVFISILVSIFTAFVSYYGIGSSFQNSQYAKPLFILSLVIGALMLSTQLGFGVRNWVKIGNPTSENPYRDMMRCLFLVSISCTSMLNLLLGKQWADEAEKAILTEKEAPFMLPQETEKIPSQSPLLSQKLQPQRLYLIFDTQQKNYVIRLETQTSETKTPILLEKKSEKLFLPFVYWLYFALAKKKNILIRHEDIQVWKNRMVTYLNEKNEFPLEAFLVDGGKYELNIEAAEIFVEGLDMLKEKQSVKDIFGNYLWEMVGVDLAKYQKDKQYKAKMFAEVYEGMMGEV